MNLLILASYYILQVQPTTYALLSIRHCSTNLRSQTVTRHISLRNTEKTLFAKSDKPLVLLYCWLGAKAKHIDKYQNFYLDKGFDVASVKVSYRDILRPQNAQKIADDVTTFANTDPYKNSPVLAHCFSVGAYMYSEALVKINDNEQLNNNLGKRIHAQIYDSPVDLDVIPTGMANATTENPILNSLIKSTTGSYLFLSSPWVTKHYLKASRAFKSNQLKAPSLFLYSQADPVCFPDLLEKIMNDFRNSDIDVWGQCWDDSKHVSHFHKYPEEYINLLEMISKQTKLTS